MNKKKQYLNFKNKLLFNKDICKENKKLFGDFLEKEEYKLKRVRDLSSLDNAAYKTLIWYVSHLKTVNGWFNNKAWYDLTEKDIKKVYDGLEDGHIKSQKGTPFKDTNN